MNQPVVDYYKVLQIRYGAKKEDIISSYRRLCKLYHPDVNRDPRAEETMKQINMAYSILFDDLRREEYNRIYTGADARDAALYAQDEKKVQGVMNDYFKALLDGNYERAYYLLSVYDRQYVTIQSFCNWRRSVQRVFVMKEYAIKNFTEITKLTLENGKTVPARKLYINITEKNVSTLKLDHYQVTKFVVSENGVWRAFLGYRDLNEIAKTFENLSIQQQRGEMAKLWEEYCEDMCRELAMLSLKGFVKQTERELYRYKRYSQPLVVACVKVKPLSGFMSEEAMVSAAEAVASIISASLRDTDTPAYVGRGVFAILYVELRKRHANMVLRRLVSAIEAKLPASIMSKVKLSFDYSVYNGDDIRTYIEKNSAIL